MEGERLKAAAWRPRRWGSGDVVSAGAAVGYGRYRLIDRWGGEDGAGRFLGLDEKLGRTVLAWVLDAPEGDVRRDSFFALARACARLTHPGFLQVLDVSREPERLSVILQAPDGLRPADEPPALPALVATAVGLEVGDALDQAVASGLAPARLPIRYLCFERDQVRLDPIGVAMPADAAAPSPARLVVDLLDAIAGGAAASPGTGAFDPGAGTVRRLIAAWRDDPARIVRPEALRQLLSELRVAASTGVPAGTLVPARQERAGEATGPFEAARLRLTTTRAVPLAPSADVAAAHAGDPPDREPDPSAPDPPPAGRRGRRERGASARTGRSGRSAAPAGAARPTRVSAHRPLVLRVLPVVATLALGLIVAAGIGAWREGRNEPAANGTSVANTAAAGPAVPADDRVVVQVTAQESTDMRVTVDGSVEFEGALAAGESRAWEGGERIQVWTNRGKSLLITINGFELGPYSPAMGHPEWNRIDFGFTPAWRP